MSQDSCHMKVLGESMSTLLSFMVIIMDSVP